jgi:hypothetical protein
VTRADRLSWLFRLLGVGWAVAILASCGTPPTQPCGCAWPPLVAYSAEFNARLAAELREADAGAAWPVAIADYRGLRAQIRAMEGAP